MPTYRALPDDPPPEPAAPKPSTNSPEPLPLDGSESAEEPGHHRNAKPIKTPQSRASIIFRGLVYELISVAVAAASFLGLLVLLRAYDNKPEPKWSPAPWAQRITLNTLVSIVSTVFRSCILFPVATCISQFGWIWMTNPGGRSLQDLTSYNSASGGLFGSLNLLWRLRFWHYASIGAAITLLGFVSGPFFQQSVDYDLRSVIDPAFTPSANAVAAYSWGEGIPGWNYAQDAFQVLPCNMTAAILAGLFAPDQTSPPKPVSNCPTGNCTWESFGTLSVNSKCVDISSHLEARVNKTEYYLETPGDALPQRTLNETGSNIINKTIEAFRCAVYFSAKEVLPRVENGVYSEEVLQEVTRPENVQFLDEGEKVGARRYFVYIHDSWDPLVFRLPGLPPNRRNNFTVPMTAFVPIYSQMMHDLQGTVLWGVGQKTETTPVLLNKADSVVQSIQNMADSVTNEMRRNESSTGPERAIQGHVWIQQQFVVVRWAWLALPASMLVLTSLFLAATIVETRRKDVGVWLSSPLVLFFNAHLDSSGKDVLSNANPKCLNTAEGNAQVAAGLKATIFRGSRTIDVVATEPAKAQESDVEMRPLRRSNEIDTSVGEGRKDLTSDHRRSDT
ncbi:hypothetical protein CMUS01_15973 [Colletotrichum musicola]|uniref:Uncharacterized protein n=1 Tax=Colletotrichum musicola TaxID=2175873 RepID=A0A8H6IT09_9PEZI|nr:hypothetical protein CMUS01_15973 [Colletotrichum musicola]